MAKTEKKWYQQSKIYRYITQGIVFLFMLNVYFRHVIFLEGNVEEYCPFGGLETLYSYLTTGVYLKHINPMNLTLFTVIMLMTLALRGGFCGWICPIGTAQEIIRAVGKKIGGLPFLKATNKKYRAWLKRNENGFRTADFWARKVKYLILVVLIVGTWTSAELLIRDYDLIIALIKILSLEITFGFVILAIAALLSFFMDRPFCKYFCVMGATINLVGKLSPLRIVRDSNTCINCNLCNKSCPMKLEIAKKPLVNAIDCNHCFKCIDACPVNETLSLKYFPKGLYSIPEKTNESKLEG